MDRSLRRRTTPAPTVAALLAAGTAALARGVPARRAHRRRSSPSNPLRTEAALRGLVPAYDFVGGRSTQDPIPCPARPPRSSCSRLRCWRTVAGPQPGRGRWTQPAVLARGREIAAVIVTDHALLAFDRDGSTRRYDLSWSGPTADGAGRLRARADRAAVGVGASLVPPSAGWVLLRNAGIRNEAHGPLELKATYHGGRAGRGHRRHDVVPH